MVCRWRPDKWLLAVAWVACVGGASCISYENPVPTRRMEVGRVLARVSQPDSAGVFESLSSLAVAPDAQSVYVLDRLAARVHRVSVAGEVLATFGRRGQGPHEMARPVAVRAGERGVWVLDAERGRFLLFTPDGEFVEAVAPNASWLPGTTFAPVGDGVVFPDLSSIVSTEGGETLLAHARAADDGFVSLDVSVPIPEELASGSDLRGMTERQIGWVLQAVSPGEVALALNRSTPSVWSVRWRGEHITEVELLRIPPEVGEAVNEILQADRPPPGAELRPITGVHAVNGRLWVTTGGIQPKLLAFSVPPSPRMVPTVIGPGSLSGGDRIRDAVVIGQRLIAITETEILWAELVGGLPG